MINNKNIVVIVVIIIVIIIVIVIVIVVVIIVIVNIVNGLLLQHLAITKSKCIDLVMGVCGEVLAIKESHLQRGRSGKRFAYTKTDVFLLLKTKSFNSRSVWEMTCFFRLSLK